MLVETDAANYRNRVRLRTLVEKRPDSQRTAGIKLCITWLSIGYSRSTRYVPEYDKSAPV